MLFSLLSLVSLSIACGDNDGSTHGHVHEQREYPQVPLQDYYASPVIPNFPERPLVWGDFNVIHTTDSHGWLLGHQKGDAPEPNYSGTLGDFASFVKHMNDTAARKKVDLLLVDTGDLHDGTGLSDGYPSGAVDGHDSSQFLLQLPYDLMTIGNHELNNYTVTNDTYYNFVPKVRKGRYLTSNAYITVNESGPVPIGSRSVTFNTTQGRTVTSFGVMFDYKSTNNTKVTPVAEMVTERWFNETINVKPPPDVFLLIGHMPVSCDNWPIVFNAIRKIHPFTPILIFGGHTHIRDCQQYDSRSMALESGRYMETIGWMSADLPDSKDNHEAITFSRRYLDQNKVTYKFHANLTPNVAFDTTMGDNITQGLRQLAAKYNLDCPYGTSNQTYTWDQSPYPSNGSVLSLFEEALPVAIPMRNHTPSIIITNSMVLRYDIFEGPFTKNDQLTASPYADTFLYIPDVPADIAKQVLPAMNGDFPPASSSADKELWDYGHVEGKRSNNVRTPGYVTMDGCLGEGDDTRHTPLPHYYTPKYIGSAPQTDNKTIDIVFIKQGPVGSAVIAALKKLKYNPKDVFDNYTDITTNEVLGIYAQKKWSNTSHHYPKTATDPCAKLY